MDDGRKDDQTKLRYDLMPTRAEELIMEVLTYGAAKYGPDNWRRVPDLERRYYAATRRHLAAWFSGEKLDPDSKLPHLAHAATGTIFLLEHQHPKPTSMSSVVGKGHPAWSEAPPVCPACNHLRHQGCGCSFRDCPCAL